MPASACVNLNVANVHPPEYIHHYGATPRPLWYYTQPCDNYVCRNNVPTRITREKTHDTQITPIIAYKKRVDIAMQL